jgi:hypothetical protein
VELRVGGSASTRLPGIGLGLAANAPPLSSREIARLKALRPAHLRVDLNLADPGYAQLLQRAAIGVPLEGGVFLSDAAGEELRGLARHVGGLRPPAARWLIFHSAERSTSGRWVRLARQHLSGEIGAGTDANFTELNRERPELDGLDLVCYSANPQVHAFDDRSLVETFEGLRDTVRTARQFSGAAKLAVTPITFNECSPLATPEILK